jgi:hypothetical protein
VFSADGEKIGTVDEVFRDVGLVESFGSAGIPPHQAGSDPANYSYSEGAPGAGDNYFTMRSPSLGLLYVPFGAVESAEVNRVVVAVDADNVESMNWAVRPDVLSGPAGEYPKDRGAEPRVA